LTKHQKKVDHASDYFHATAAGFTSKLFLFFFDSMRWVVLRLPAVMTVLFLLLDNTIWCCLAPVR